MSLVDVANLELTFGSGPLLDGVTFAIERGERVCLVGRNGTGKSTLLGVVTGAVEADDGEVRVDPGASRAVLAQSVPAGVSGTVEEVVAGGLGEESDTVALERTLSRLALQPDARFDSLSGGLKRRTLLAQALVARPDLLVLDEPTNHFDITAIEWLESTLRGWRGAVLFTTHDRRLIEQIATRILELDRGRLTSWPGDYANYLRRREERRAAEASDNARFDRKLAQEEVWIRQGIKARRTRNEGRVRKLEAMRKERAARRDAPGVARFDIGRAGASGKRVIEARGVCFDYGDGAVVRDLDLLIERGDRVGIIGPNGSGKSTLLRLLIGELEPTAGEVEFGTRLELSYFDQHRAILRDEATVADSVADGADFVETGGGRRHIIGYLADFLFERDRASSPVRSLSGGERARLLLARLFAKPSNFLVLDEPTNDLDSETLELLEERLLEYPGTVLLVSHDRAFLDNVVTSTLVFEGDGRVGEYVGGYRDWLRQREDKAAAPPPVRREAVKPARPRPARLGYMQQRELAALPGQIEALEARIATLQERMADPAVYQAGDGEEIRAIQAELAGLEAELEVAFERWSELESQDAGG